MKLNLRKARKLESKIDRHLQEIRGFVTPSITVPRGMEEAVVFARLDSEVDLFNRKLDSYQELMSIRYNIRMAIGEANGSSGLNQALSAKEGLTAQLVFLRNILSNLTVRSSKEEIQALLRRDAVSHYDTTLTFSLLTEAEKKSLSSQILALENKLDALEDQISALNLSNTIEITENQVAVLRLLQLV